MQNFSQPTTGAGATRLWLCLGAAFVSSGALCAAEFHVAVDGSDSNPGTKAAPFRSIQQAANRAHPGDIITVHQGIYRERVNPPRGGVSDALRITYQAAPGETVVIKGSEIVKGWEPVTNDTWKVTLANGFFGGFNPFQDTIRGDWFLDGGRLHHTGAVYVRGHWLNEAARLEEACRPVGGIKLWYATVGETNTTVWAQFDEINPNEEEIEVNARPTVFYPDRPWRDYITVRGFTMEHAATPWAPPTAEQMGLIGTHWAKGWVIEGNVIRYSRCSGVALGKYGDEWDNRAESAEGYVGTIARALTNGWNKAGVGGHIVRNNRISHCEQTGIVGSLGCAFSTVTGNEIHDIHVLRLFSGYEQAGIKFHGAVDVEISGNHIHGNGSFGIWLDWMAQGARVTGNLLHDNLRQDLFMEVDHGPFVVDNNLFLSRSSLHINSQGGAFVHNLMAGAMDVIRYDSRLTPLHKPHSTEVAGLHDNPDGDMRFYNNLFIQGGETVSYNKSRLDVSFAGNVYLKGARASERENGMLLKPDFDPGVRLEKTPAGWILELALDPAWRSEQPRKLVTTETLGRAIIPDLPFENADSSPLSLSSDYAGARRDVTNPFPGPFETVKGGKQSIRVWPDGGPAGVSR